MHFISNRYLYLIFTVGSTSSGRARSDPTHQHHGHHHAHSHSASQSHAMVPNPSTMECESPQAHCQRAPPPAHQSGRTLGVWDDRHSNNGGSSVHTGHSFTIHRGHHHHHHGGYQSGPLAAVQSSTTSLSSTSSSSSSALPGPQNMLVGNVYGAEINHPHAQRPQPGLLPSATLPVDLSTLHHHHGHPPHSQNTLQGIEPQLSSLSMQLSGYPPQYSQFPQQSWQAANYPFTMASSVPQPLSSHEGGTSAAHSRTAADRGDESPMVGVCVQQSPVASH